MRERVVIEFGEADGAVVRMIGLVERRGFLVRGIAMVSTAEGASMTLDVEPRDPSRRLEVLQLQLGRLQEVRNVSFPTSQGAV